MCAEYSLILLHLQIILFRISNAVSKGRTFQVFFENTAAIEKFVLTRAKVRSAAEFFVVASEVRSASFS